MDTSTDLSFVKGVGEKTAAILAKAGLHTVKDLLYFLPRTYEDFSVTQSIASIKPGRVVVRAKVENIESHRKRRGLSLAEATLVDNSGKMRAVWFNQPYRVRQFKPNEYYYFSGEFEFNYGRYQLMNPSAELASDYQKTGNKIVPIYKSSHELKPAVTRKLIKALKPYIAVMPDNLPDSVVEDDGLLPRAQALYKIHFPDSQQDIKTATHRLAYEEVFELVLASVLNKDANKKLRSKQIPFDQKSVREFVVKLPFKLTDSQRLAAWEIIQDFEKSTPMNRLLQGDVGSGKTVVAGLAAYQAAKAGLQTAIMAPTEILAAQHAETLNNLLKVFGVTVALLTSGSKNKTKLQAKIAAGQVDIIVGTHALIAEKVQYKNLGFVVIDEQHRFGVNQRLKLLGKGKVMPHLLSMTATPIPRSLQLTVFGELDISTLNELPQGRKPIKTEIISPNSVDSLYKKVEEQLQQGRQAYYICSLIDENGEQLLKSVTQEYQHLKTVFKGYKIGLLHGRMTADDKNTVLNDFLAKKLDLLVSTTVIEVGVDVPNATVMVIRDADRFGLAQLHQIRGRVGRSTYQSYCYLITSTSAKPTARLQEIVKSNDGFYLAQKDLELRGPGEIYGKLQHGALDLRVATLTDTKLLATASRAAKKFVTNGRNLLDYKELADKVQKYQRLTTLN
ncbi:ATP-dependent DNA helicase RecG [Candidatus Saccharibacteria bacterium]|nr:ATP-dependent DNA helicase RecG [Candidatus Saccharibacteria bacterium]